MRDKKSASISSRIAAPASLPPKICAPPERLHEGRSCYDHGCTGRACGFRVPAADSSARGIFYLTAVALRKLMATLQGNEPLTTAAAPRAERKREHAQAVGATRLRRRAHPRDQRALDIILSIGHNSGLAALVDARSGQLSHAKSPAKRRRVGDHGFAASDVMDRGLLHVLPWPWLGFIPYRDSRQARPRAA